MFEVKYPTTHGLDGKVHTIEIAKAVELDGPDSIYIMGTENGKKVTLHLKRSISGEWVKIPHYQSEYVKLNLKAVRGRNVTSQIKNELSNKKIDSIGDFGIYDVHGSKIFGEREEEKKPFIPKVAARSPIIVYEYFSRYYIPTGPHFSGKMDDKGHVIGGDYHLLTPVELADLNSRYGVILKKFRIVPSLEKDSREQELLKLIDKYKKELQEIDAKKGSKFNFRRYDLLDLIENAKRELDKISLNRRGGSRTFSTSSPNNNIDTNIQNLLDLIGKLENELKGKHFALASYMSTEIGKVRLEIRNASSKLPDERALRMKVLLSRLNGLTTYITKNENADGQELLGERLPAQLKEEALLIHAMLNNRIAKESKLLDSKTMDKMQKVREVLVEIFSKMDSAPIEQFKQYRRYLTMITQCVYEQNRQELDFLLDDIIAEKSTFDGDFSEIMISDICKPSRR